MDTDRIKGAAQELGGKVQEAAGRVFGDRDTQAEGIIRQVAGRGQNYYGQAKDGLSSAADTVSDYAGTVSDYANQAYRTAGPQAERGTRLVRERVGDNPLTAVLLAGAIGYLLALAVHGRH